MKYLKIIIPVFVLLTIGCASQNIDMNFDSIKYEARTRGSMTLINVDTKEVSYKLPKKEGVYELSKEQLISLNELINLIKLTEIADLKAPTNNSATDMALIGKITIVLKGKEYVSSSFDAGNPPKELKKLEDLLYSLIKK